MIALLQLDHMKKMTKLSDAQRREYMLSLPPAAQDDLARLNILTQGKQSGSGHKHGEHCNHSHVHEHSAHCNHGPADNSSHSSSGRQSHSSSSHNHSHTHEHGAHCNH
jgi:hypothetical protein